MIKNIFSIFLILFFLVGHSSIAKEKNVIPRFASIKASEANTRKGPGAQYPAINIYQYKSLPVEIIAEYEQWRQIRDIEGDEGWMHSSILSNKRSVIINTKDPETLYKSDSLRSRVVAKLEPKLVCLLNKCIKSWCKVKCQDYTGWVGRSSLWGVYENEEF